MSKGGAASAKRVSQPSPPRISSSAYHTNCYAKALERGQGEITLDQNVVHQDAIWKNQVRFEADLSRRWQDNYGYMRGEGENKSSSPKPEHETSATGVVGEYPRATSQEIGWVGRPEKIVKIETSEFHGRQKSGLSYV